MEQNKLITLEEAKKIIREKIDTLNQCINSLDNVSVMFSSNGAADNHTDPLPAVSKLSQSKKPGNVKIVKKQAKEGVQKFSKFLIGIFHDNPTKDYDLMTLNTMAQYAIDKGVIAKPAGKIKDEIGKRIFQFRKRNIVVKSINGGYMYSGPFQDKENNKQT